MPRADDIHRGSDDAARSRWGTTAWPPGWDVRHVAETGSTNADLLRLHADGAAGDRTVLVADHQTAGRGRRDRRWEAPPGANLLVSLLFVEVPASPGPLVQRVGLAIAGAVDAFVRNGTSVALKWPNDVLIDGRKAAGILAERSEGAVVVGAGVNVGWAPEDAAGIVSASAGAVPHPAEVLAAILATHDALPMGEELTALYRARLATLGGGVRAELPDGSALQGDAVDLDTTGALIVRDAEGVRHVLHAADVVHLRPR